VSNENILAGLKKPVVTRLDLLAAHAELFKRGLNTSDTKFLIMHEMGEEIFTREEVQVGLAYLRLQGKLKL